MAARFLDAATACVFAFVAGLIFMPAKIGRAPLPRFDWTGFILVCIALVCIMSAIGNGHRWGWGSDKNVLTAIAGIIAFICL